jgi:hypothetical protein
MNTEQCLSGNNIIELPLPRNTHYSDHRNDKNRRKETSNLNLIPV